MFLPNQKNEPLKKKYWWLNETYPKFLENENYQGKKKDEKSGLSILLIQVREREEKKAAWWSWYQLTSFVCFLYF